MAGPVQVDTAVLGALGFQRYKPSNNTGFKVQKINRQPSSGCSNRINLVPCSLVGIGQGGSLGTEERTGGTVPQTG